VIGEPLNDTVCLTKISGEIVRAIESDPVVRNLARQFATTEGLSAHLRSLPQRNDVGDEGDGPRVPCDVSQRLRFGPPDPNCVERSATYLAVGELIDPSAHRQLATIDTPLGRHTFPVEDGEPVNLDPRVGRNALAAGLYRMAPGPIEMSTPETLSWIASLAAEPAAAYPNGPRRVRNAAVAFDAVLAGAELPRNGLEDMGFAVGLAEHAARLYGVRGVEAISLGRFAIEHMIGRHNRRNGVWSTIKRVGRAVGRVGEKVGGVALRAVLVSQGVPPQLIDEFERELNREGLTMGRVARPLPMLGTFASLTDEALILRAVYNRAR